MVRNLNFEKATQQVGGILVDTYSVDMTYDGVTPKIYSDVIVDNSTIEVDASVGLRLKDSGITTAKLSSPTGTDTNVVTGTKGTNGNVVSWNSDGDVVDASIAVSNVALQSGTVNQFSDITSAGADIEDAVSKKHTQNTDVSTTSTTFQLNSGSSGVKLKDNSGVAEIRNSADDAYANLKSAAFEVVGITNTSYIKRNVTTVNTATYDLLTTDDIILVTYTSTAAVTSFTLPSVQCVSGRVIDIKDAGGNAGSNTITIDTEGSEKIDSLDTYVINGDFDSITLVSNGSNWFVI